ncbi:hypothetical protein NUW58_g2285 [Xylaria curta]|uniref:Uncharacterized protein n=1 Tax=Xylaria curta TaxID=42375 RepID=A0ACC1PHY0_9PEZI|nr:hypothetical protein NUW58_g2285 [Xylaria curta]
MPDYSSWTTGPGGIKAPPLQPIPPDAVKPGDELCDICRTIDFEPSKFFIGASPSDEEEDQEGEGDGDEGEDDDDDPRLPGSAESYTGLDLGLGFNITTHSSLLHSSLLLPVGVTQNDLLGGNLLRFLPHNEML